MAVDAVAGLFLLLMMFQHFNIVIRTPHTLGHLFMFNTIYFFFKSGMFHKPVKPGKTLVIKWLKRLIVPFVVCALFGLMLEFVCEWIVAGNCDFAVFYGGLSQTLRIGAPWWNIPVWFLLTLFVVKLLTARFDGRHTLIWVSAALSIAAAHTYLVTMESFNYIGNTALAVVFYILGFKSRSIRLDESRLAVGLLAALFATLFVFFPAIIDIFHNKATYGNYFVGILFSVVGILLTNLLFEKYKYLHIRLFVFAGQNAMLLLVFHVPFYLAFCRLLGGGMLNDVAVNWLGAAFPLGCCAMISILLDRNKKLRWIIGG